MFDSYRIRARSMLLRCMLRLGERTALQAPDTLPVAKRLDVRKQARDLAGYDDTTTNSSSIFLHARDRHLLPPFFSFIVSLFLTDDGDKVKRNQDSFKTCGNLMLQKRVDLLPGFGILPFPVHIIPEKYYGSFRLKEILEKKRMRRHLI
jgi:hypothetical protein